ncbi:metallophosphoesterase [Putridiphycobacter roseus]|uniref:Metallophosphoesterase n=1 Tax=Putridiphycobacter roseus TaxID=2219161 RepID=A0A2W1NIA3_9FLAO|nr:metallophosphoesterase family protein [Putridiphycobacter roseus]PZE18753.1 metallophosphoesterase [Putridiphycobacter roseus]
MQKLKKYQPNDLFIFGGNYSNLQATLAVKNIAELLDFPSTQIICTGDVVGYCAQPEETVQLVKNWDIKVIAGNVEAQLRDGEFDCGCNFDAGSRCDLFSRSWFPYAQSKLSEDSIAWMKDLPLTISLELKGKRLRVIHGGFPDISAYIFSSTDWNAKQEFMAQLNADIVIAGHSGLPFSEQINQQYWINSGVVGMPANDGTNRCWFGILRADELQFEHHAFSYDSQTASRVMLENGLPTPYAKTLHTGIWDNCEILPEEETALQGKKIKAHMEWSY